MNNSALLLKIKRQLKRLSSLLLLFQRSPAAQILLPAELNLASSAAAIDTTKFLIATVAGLGAYDSVAGATTLSQISPAPGSATVPVTAGTPFTGVFQVTGSPSQPKSWRVDGTLPAGLNLPNAPGATATLSGTTLEVGDKVVTIRAWEKANFSGGSVSKQFTIAVSAPPGAAIITQPASTTINRGQTATLSVVAMGQDPLTYEWFEGDTGDTGTSVGANAPSFMTPALNDTTSYWVRVSNSANPSGVDSATATVTVRQPAAIVTHPASTSIAAGQSTALSVVASGDAPLAYQWYQGESGVATHPVGTDSASFTTPALIQSTSYWVKVSNVANPGGAVSNTAFITVQIPNEPSIFTGSPLPTARTGRSYQQSLVVVGGEAPHTWTLDAGSLPEGLTLGTDGVISGIPAGTGTSSFTVKVEDAGQLSDTKIFEIMVNDLAIQTVELPVAVRKVPYLHELSATGGVGAVGWSVVEGTLPDGITLNAEGQLSGTPTNPQNAAFRVRATDASGFSVEQTLALNVSATFLKPVLDPVVFTPLQIGTEFSHTLTAGNYPKTFSMKGLPKGLKLAAATGVITGRPSVFGSFDVTVTAKNSAGSSEPVVATLVVSELADEMKGTFAGVAGRDSSVNQNLGAWVGITTSSTGAYTLKLLGALDKSGSKGAGAAYSAKGFLAASPPHVSVTLGGRDLRLTLGDALTGSLQGVPFTGRRLVWNAKSNAATTLEGYYSIALPLADAGDKISGSIPQGTGFATFTVALSGALAVVGRTGDAEPFTSAGFAGSDGTVTVYAPVYKKLGTLLGDFRVDAADTGIEDNIISGSLSWSKPAGMKTRAYAGGFGPVNLSVEGACIGPATKRKQVLGLPAPGNFSLTFQGAGLELSATDPDSVFAFTDKLKVAPPPSAQNPAKVTLAITPASGKVAGKFSLVETTSPLKRSNVPFLGQVVRLSDGSVKAAGYFLLPQIPGSGEKPAATPILSGEFSLEQAAP